MKRASTEEDRDRRFQMETSRRLGERTAWRMDPTKPMNVVKPAVITNTSLPLPYKEHANPALANASGQSLRLSRSANTLSTSASSVRQTPQRPKEVVSAVTAKPRGQGIRKSPYQSPYRKGTTIGSTTAPSTATQSNSAYLQQLKRLSSSVAISEPVQLTGEKDELFDEAGVEEDQTTLARPPASEQTPVQSRPGGSRNPGANVASVSHRKLIPIQKPRKEPNLFHIKKPHPPRPPPSKCTRST